MTRRAPYTSGDQEMVIPAAPKGPASGARKKREPKPDPIQGLNDAQVLGMIKVLSEQLLDYTREWERRQERKLTDVGIDQGNVGRAGPHLP